MAILVMKDYLAIIRKFDFIDLFKYGQFCISNAVAFDGFIFKHANDDDLFDALTLKMNVYEYSFEYLILHFKANESDSQYLNVDIKNVQGIYTFDIDAKKEMSISFDPRIQLHISPWADKFKKLQQKLSVKQSMRGIDNLWTIFDLPQEDKKKCEELISKEVVQEVFRELYAYERPSGDLSIWTYLLRYERHSFYPQDMLGYFCDFIHVCCNYTKKTELSEEVAETTQLYKQLALSQNTQFATLYKIVEASPLSMMTEQATGCRFAITATLFLFLKAKFADRMEYKSSKEAYITYAKEIGGFEFSLAIFLLGFTLGHDKTYDAFYEATNLPFFKKKSVVIQDDPTENPENSNTQISEISDGGAKDEPPITDYSPKDEPDVQINTIGDKPGDLFPPEEFPPIPHLPIMWMKKKQKGQSAEVRPVYKKEELEKFSSLGYERVNRFDANVKKIILSYGFDPESEKKRLAKNK